MEGIPSFVGKGGGPSNLPDLNSPAAEEDPGDRHAQKGKSVETAIYEVELAKIQEQKDRLADRIRPLIEEEAQRCRRQYGHREQGALPSPNEMVDKIINRFASKGAQVANAPNAPLYYFRYLKKWLTRAEKSAEKDGDGGMSIRNLFFSSLTEHFDYKFFSLQRSFPTSCCHCPYGLPDRRRIIGTPTPGRVSEPCNRRPFRAVRGALESAAGARQRLDPYPIFGPIPPSYYQKMRFLPNPSLLLQPLPN